MRRLEDHCPPKTAESWDNVGLLAGDPAWTTTGAVVSIDLTRESLAEARARGYRLIVNHHPCIFPRSRGLSRLVPGQGPALTGLILEAYCDGIAVAALHTNFDRCALEVVRAISDGLSVVPQGRLHEGGAGELKKLVVFVPATHAEAVRTALVEAGTGHIGNYDHCTFGQPGTGTFRGLDGSRPFLGKPGTLERAEEIRLETVFPKGFESRVLRALLSSHPYEEVAYDIYPVEQSPPAKGLASGLGYGFWGDLPAPRPFSEMAKGVRSLFKLDGFLLTDPAPKDVKRVAFVAGKGASFIPSAAALGCDLFITGEAGYHSALDGARYGMTVMELGHRESERFFVSTLEAWIHGAGLASSALHVPTQRFFFKEQP